MGDENHEETPYIVRRYAGCLQKMKTVILAFWFCAIVFGACVGEPPPLPLDCICEPYGAPSSLSHAMDPSRLLPLRDLRCSFVMVGPHPHCIL
jgi:hypothetical protein